MSQNYDNWERLVRAVLRRESDRQMAFIDSCSVSSRSSTSDLTISQSDHKQAVDDYADLSMLHTDWRMLLPRGKKEVVWKSASQSFFLDKRTGKNCFTFGASKLVTLDADFKQRWEFKPHPKSRFSEVAELVHAVNLDIQGKIKTEMLSPETFYSAYLVYGLNEWRINMGEIILANTSFHDESDYPSSEQQVRTVKFQPGNGGRGDGWMEVEIGDFYVYEGDKRNVEVKLYDLSAVDDMIAPELYYDLGVDEMSELELYDLGVDEMSGLIVEGMEFRPKRGGKFKGIFSNFRTSSKGRDPDMTSDVKLRSKGL